jgi:hypothetical protein
VKRLADVVRGASRQPARRDGLERVAAPLV